MDFHLKLFQIAPKSISFKNILFGSKNFNIITFSKKIGFLYAKLIFSVKFMLAIYKLLNSLLRFVFTNQRIATTILSYK